MSATIKPAAWMCPHCETTSSYARADCGYCEEEEEPEPLFTRADLETAVELALHQALKHLEDGETPAKQIVAELLGEKAGG